MRPFAKEAAAEKDGEEEEGRFIASTTASRGGCHGIYSHSRSGCETAAAAVDFDYRDLCFVAINFGVDMLFDVGPRKSDRQTDRESASQAL